MDTAVNDFLQQLPKAPLPVHRAGTLEPGHTFSDAQRHAIKLHCAAPAP